MYYYYNCIYVQQQNYFKVHVVQMITMHMINIPAGIAQ